MKTALLLLVIVSVCCGRVPVRKWEYSGEIKKFVEKFDYTINSYEIETEDGYKLDLFRIPNGRQEKKEVFDKSSSEEDKVKPAVLLMHGMFSDSEDFVIGGPSQGLAFILADAGYDVYLGNSRGSIYGQKHTTLDPKKDAAFWKFGVHEKGVKDLVAIVDKVIDISGRASLSYIGHNEGTTAFYIMLATKPEYNEKFDIHISLGPMAYEKNSESKILDNIVDHLQSKSWIMKHVGVSTFSPSTELIETAKTKCVESFDNQMCTNPYFLLFGYNSENMNKTTLEKVLSRLPSSGSVTEILHLAALKSSGRFQKYADDGEGEDYELSKITAPAGILYTPKDPISHVDDVEKLIKEMPNVKTSVMFDQLYNNLDLLYSKNIDDVYDTVLKMLKDRLH